MEHPSTVEMEMSFTNLNEIEDEYVFIREQDMEFDEESYDHCDLSPDLSCAASVCSGVTLNDFKVESSMISLEEDRNDAESNESKKDSDVMDGTAPGRRLCNKKRRKKLKMMKKAAAAAHFEANRKAQLEVSNTSSPDRTVVERSKTSGKTKSKSGVHSLAVACAQESLAAYREETGSKQKKSMVNYIL